MIARYHCTPDSPADEWARLQRALADFDDETEEIYERLIRERYHARPAAEPAWKSSTESAALNGHSNMETATRR